MELLIALTTFPDKERATDAARILVEEKLCACVNILPGVTSLYVWEGKSCEDSEVLALIKTSADKASELERRLLELHPYDTPEFILLSPASVNERYLSWALNYLK